MSIRGLFPIDEWAFNSESILQDLPLREIELLLANQAEQAYLEGQVIFREGSIPSGIFYIREGKVKKYKTDKEGNVQIIYIANSGELIGYHAILAEDRYPDSAATLEKSKIVFIPKKDFLEAIRQSDTLSKRLLKTLSHEFTVLVNSVSLHSQKSVRERLALQLIILREKYKKDSPAGTSIQINISRYDLANLVGTARENVVRTLSEFREQGILATKGRKIIVNDVKSLIDIANYK